MRRTIPFHKMYQIMSAFLLIAPSHRAEDRTMVFCHRTNEVKAFFVTALNAFIQRIADIKASAASGKLANRRAQCGLLCQAEESGGDVRPTLSSARGCIGKFLDRARDPKLDPFSAHKRQDRGLQPERSILALPCCPWLKHAHCALHEPLSDQPRLLRHSLPQSSLVLRQH
jgi:hypothetical protein